MGVKARRVKTFLTSKIINSSAWKKATLTTILSFVVVLGAGSTYAALHNAKTGGDYLAGYNGRIQLNPFNHKVSSSDFHHTNFGKLQLEGKTYDFDDPKTLRTAIQQAAEAFSNYQISLKRENFVVNFSNLNTHPQANSTRALDLYFHAPSFPDVVANPHNPDDSGKQIIINNKKNKVPYNLNNAWFNLVHLNQLSVDRYGFDYNDDGSVPSENQPSVKTIIPFNNVGISQAKLLTMTENKFNGLSFNIYHQPIPVAQLKILANKNANRYQIPPQFSEKGVENTFDVWLDKELLAYRLNYIFQTYVFNQTWAYQYDGVSRIIGQPNSPHGGQTAEQFQNYQRAKHNFVTLTDQEKEFGKNYHTAIVDSSYVDSVNIATDPDQYISADHLITIYNRFKKRNLNTKLFDGHLLARISGGEKGNWTQFFPKYNQEVNKNYQEKLDPNQTDDLKPLWSLNQHHQVIADPNNHEKQANDPNKKQLRAEENTFRLAVDHNLTSLIDNKTLYERITKYQVRYLTLRKQAIYRNKNDEYKLQPLSIVPEYVDQKAAKSLALSKMSFAPPLAGTIGFWSNIDPNSLWWIIIASVIVLLMVGIIVAWLYRVPGLIALGFWFTATSTSLATFFHLNLDLTTNAVTGFVTSLLVSFVSLFHNLNYFIQQVKDGSSLRKASGLTVKNNLIFNFDLFVISFFTGTIFAFLAIIELSKFGLMLSMSCLISFLLYGIGYNLTNWLLVNTFLTKPRWFVNRKNQIVLNSLSGQISPSQPNFFGKEFAPFPQKFYSKFFGKGGILYFIFFLSLLIAGLIIIFIPKIGFGSSFVLKDGTIIQLTIDEKNIVGGNTKINGQQVAISPIVVKEQIIPQLQNYNLVEDLLPAYVSNDYDQAVFNDNDWTKFQQLTIPKTEQFFFKTTKAIAAQKIVELFSQYLQPNSYSVQKTTLFSIANTLSGELKMIALSLAIMSFYYMLRYNWLAVGQLWITSWTFLALTVALMGLTRITVTRNLVDLLLLIHLLSLITNSWLLTNFRNKYQKFQYYEPKGFYQLIWTSFSQNFLPLFLVISSFGLIGILGASFNLLQLRYAFVYFLIALLILVFVILPLIMVLWARLMLLRQKIFYNYHPNQKQHNLSLRYRMKNHDQVDEQLIAGINFFGG